MINVRRIKQFSASNKILYETMDYLWHNKYVAFQSGDLVKMDREHQFSGLIYFTVHLSLSLSWDGSLGTNQNKQQKITTSQFNLFNTLRPRKNGRRFTEDVFKCIFLNENAWISLKISLKFVPNGSINNIPTLVQIMAWRRTGDKPLSEPMMDSLLTHICVTRPQWVNEIDMETKNEQHACSVSTSLQQTALFKCCQLSTMWISFSHLVNIGSGYG